MTPTNVRALLFLLALFGLPTALGIFTNSIALGIAVFLAMIFVSLLAQ